MRTPFAAFVSSSTLAAAALLAFSGTAHAEDASPAAPAAATVAPAPAPADAARSTAEEAPAFKPLTLSINPLSLALMRLGANIEYLPVKHHAIVANPYFQSISVGTDSDSTSYTSFGGELGYHYYTGNKGANGFFVGPSLVFQTANAKTKTTTGGTPSETSDSLASYGVALDVGGQHVFDNGFTIGAGAGMMYLLASNENTQTSSTVKFHGVLPRVLFTIGYSF